MNHSLKRSFLALLLVICVADQLTSVNGRDTGHSQQTRAGSDTNDDEKMENLMEEVLDEVRHQKQLLQSQRKELAEIRREQLVERETSLSLKARLDHSFTPVSGQNDIEGVATRSNKLYIGYHRPALNLYDASTFSLQRRLNVTGATCIADMASCPDCDVVFIADPCRPFKIHVIDDVGLRTQWSVSDAPGGVSVNSQLNVVVTFHYARKLREYTPSGELIREITLHSDIPYPLHAIQLDNDRYIVSHGLYGANSQHQVCIVNGNGAVVQCYGGQYGSGVGQLDWPGHLAIFGESLLVADHYNYRVLQLNVSSLTYIGELINTRSEVCRPVRLAMNENDARLYVAYYSCPIAVFTLFTE